MVYVVYSVIAWLLGLPKVELPSDTGGGAPVEEDRDFMEDPASYCMPGSVFYSDATCSSSTTSSLDD